MKLFLERLREVGGHLLFAVVALLAVGLVAWGIAAMPLLAQHIVVGTIVGLFTLLILLGILLSVWDFIKWLFIEPFRRKK